ncbi:MAG: hypothetical protein IPP94_07525 [Ignavibacteria bacterium]|nr:hypothetical protein [Ignavibacteria bacterium]
MLTSVEGTYRNGRIELKEPPGNIQSGTPVIVTFMGSSDIDLGLHGISPAQAEELRAALATFSDWNEVEMDVYNDYDAARANR